MLIQTTISNNVQPKSKQIYHNKFNCCSNVIHECSSETDLSRFILDVFSSNPCICVRAVESSFVIS